HGVEQGEQRCFKRLAGPEHRVIWRTEVQDFGVRHLPAGQLGHGLGRGGASAGLGRTVLRLHYKLLVVGSLEVRYRAARLSRNPGPTKVRAAGLYPDAAGRVPSTPGA